MGSNLDMHALTRAVACSFAFAMGLWGLLFWPRAILGVAPALWTTGPWPDPLPARIPITRTQAYELGRLVEQYHTLGCAQDDGRAAEAALPVSMQQAGVGVQAPVVSAAHPPSHQVQQQRHTKQHSGPAAGFLALFTSITSSDGDGATCASVLENAGQVVGSSGPLTAEELLSEKAFMVQDEGVRSAVSRFGGLINLVNLLKTVALIGLICSLGPCLARFCAPVLGERLASLHARISEPATSWLHTKGILEVAAYGFAFELTLQGCRCLKAREPWALPVSLAGCLVFALCMVYSVKLHSCDGSDKVLSSMLALTAVAAMLPLALIHRSWGVGLIAVAAVHYCVATLFAVLGERLFFPTSFKDSAFRCGAASLIVMLMSAGLRTTGVIAKNFEPFWFGSWLVGDVGYFASLLLISSRQRADLDTYKARQALLLISVVFAFSLGYMLKLEATMNTAIIAILVWILQKEMEVEWGHFSWAILFVNCCAVFFLAELAGTHPTGLFILLQSFTGSPV
mmetsp:Transcript_29478/g.67925  ORF Transcript_29478/g.67925 Transcript_29478/m.67925 type:complete len:512 (+) Transcript_29478:161-1696(+)